MAANSDDDPLSTDDPPIPSLAAVDKTEIEPAGPPFASPDSLAAQPASLPSTPPDQSPLTAPANAASGSTPRISRGSHGINAQTQNLLLSRFHLRRDMGAIQVIKIDEFVGGSLPKIQGINLANTSVEILAQLKTLGLIRNNRLVGFPRDPSKMTGKYENKVFTPLEDLIEHIIKFAEARDDFKQLGLVSDIEYFKVQDTMGQAKRDNTARPDVILKSKVSMMVGPALLKLPPGSYFWCDVIAFIEYRKLKRWEDQISNFDKILWNGNHCFTMDACRRAVYSISIEDFNMRIWSFSRAGCVVSEPFHWIRAHATFIHVILSLAFASRANRGYDPNIKCLWVPTEQPDMGIQYQIDCGSFSFITTGAPLSDFQANLFIGRATHVLKVYMPENPLKFYALRLVWLAKDVVPEEVILETIYKKVKPEKRRFFPTYICAGSQKVPYLDGNSVDDETDLFIPSSLRRVAWYPTKSNRRKARVLRTMVTRSSRTVTSGAIYSTPGCIPMSSLLNDSVVNVSFFRREYFIPRVQHYIVYNEISIPLHDLRNFRHVLLALMDTVFALHECGFLHRDVSTGNILVFIQNDKVTVRLSDFEYTKCLDDPTSSSQIKTGTLQFMPLEIQSSKYLFWGPKGQQDESSEVPNTAAPEEIPSTPESQALSPPPSLITGPISESDKTYLSDLSSKHQHGMVTAQQDQEGSESVPKKKRKRAEYPVHYNCFHDLESLFWILLWFLLYHVPDGVTMEEKDVKKQLNTAHHVFTDHDDMDDPLRDRMGTLTLSAVLASISNSIPEEFATVTATVISVRDHMQHVFEEAEEPFEAKNPFPIKTMAPGRDYAGLADLFYKAAKELTKKKDPVWFHQLKPTNTNEANPEPTKKKRRKKNACQSVRAIPVRASERLQNKAQQGQL